MLISFPNYPFPSLATRNPSCRDHHPFFFRESLKFGSARKFPSIIRVALITNPDDFEVGRFVGSYGFMNVTSYSSFRAGGLSSATTYEKSLGYSSEDIERLRIQDVGEGQVKIRLYEGRVIQGQLKGTRIIFKVYPGQRAGGSEADMMAANELNAHASLQSDAKSICQNLQILLGGFETKTGEQWLAFRNDGIYSAADYAKFTGQSMTKDLNMIWNPYDRDQKLKRRRLFVIKLLNGAIRGLAFMHDHDRLHQSLGPASVVLNTIVERDAAYLVPRLRDLAFSVDVGYSALQAGPGPLSDGLWRRASAAGAFTPLEKRAFGIADDIYEAGFLFAFLAFIPFCEAGTMDALSLQRLFESTFQLDLNAAREYCLADDRLVEGVKFLDLGAGAGWELLQSKKATEHHQRRILAAASLFQVVEILFSFLHPSASLQHLSPPTYLFLHPSPSTETSPVARNSTDAFPFLLHPTESLQTSAPSFNSKPSSTSTAILKQYLGGFQASQASSSSTKLSIFKNFTSTEIQAKHNQDLQEKHARSKNPSQEFKSTSDLNQNSEENHQKPASTSSKLKENQRDLKAMLNPDYRGRPIAEAVLNHRFMTGLVF